MSGSELEAARAFEMMTITPHLERQDHVDSHKIVAWIHLMCRMTEYVKGIHILEVACNSAQASESP